MEFNQKLIEVLRLIEERIKEGHEARLSGRILFEVNMNQGGITKVYDDVRAERI